MQISKERVQQIIIEEIKRDTLMGKVRDNMKAIRNDVLELPVTISEDRSLTFGTLLKYVDRKIISETESKNFWSQSINHLVPGSQVDAKIIYEKLESLVKRNTTVDKQTLQLLQQIADAKSDKG
jgi:hypothetical protein